jgi:ubiquinone/menaquinone biosynthesis C-methylase UbiE
MSTDIRQYWDDRARAAAGNPTATTDDVYLRNLESTVLINELHSILGQRSVRILDVGCGDGKTTLDLARRFPRTSFLGIDFSQEMIASAKNYASSTHSHQVCFEVGDARALRDIVGDNKFDVVLTNRCLINIVDRQEQWAVVKEFAAALAPDGAYLGTENFLDGQENMNALRRSLNLPNIEIRWHNLYFKEAEFLAYANTIFRSVELINFSSAYYLITRCVYSALCKQENKSPDYNHPIHEVAVRIPPFGDFSPIKLIRAKK